MSADTSQTLKQKAISTVVRALRRRFITMPHECRGCGIETERPDLCYWCEMELGGEG